MIKFCTKLKFFLTEVTSDKRIPFRDKKILIAMIALLISPLDIIPDWISVIGLIDDTIILAIILDYFFDVLDQSILLSHYPWGMKSFARLKRIAGALSFLVPYIIKDNLWKYTKDPF